MSLLFQLGVGGAQYLEAAVCTGTHESLADWVPGEFPNRLLMRLQLPSGARLLGEAGRTPLPNHSLHSRREYCFVVAAYCIDGGEMLPHGHPELVALPYFEEAVVAAAEEGLPLPTEGAD